MCESLLCGKKLKKSYYRYFSITLDWTAMEVSVEAIKKFKKKIYTYIYTATNINSIYKLKVFTYTYLKLITHR